MKFPKDAKWPRFTAHTIISMGHIGLGIELLTFEGMTLNILIGPIRFCLWYWPKKIVMRRRKIEESNYRILEAYTPQEIKTALDFLSQPQEKPDIQES